MSGKAVPWPESGETHTAALVRVLSVLKAVKPCATAWRNGAAHEPAFSPLGPLGHWPRGHASHLPKSLVLRAKHGLCC